MSAATEIWSDPEAVAEAIGTTRLAPTVRLSQGDSLEDARDELALKSFERDPLGRLNILTRRRPPIELIVRTIEEQDRANRKPVVALAAEDFVIFAVRHWSNQLQMLSMLTYEPVIAGDRIGYWNRLDTFLPNHADYSYRALLKTACRQCDLLDADELAVFDRCRFSPLNREAIRAYLRDPGRTRNVFFLTRAEAGTRIPLQRNRLRRMLASAGVLAEGRPGWVSGLTAHDAGRESLVIVPPPGATRCETRAIVIGGIDETGDLTEFAAVLAFVGEALAAVPLATPAWIADPDYAVPDFADVGFPAFDWSPTQTGWLRPEVRRDKLGSLDMLLDELGLDIHAPPRPAEHNAPAETEPERPHLPLAPEETEPGPEPRSAPLVLDAQGYPRSLADLGRWAQARLPDALVILPRALRAARKAGHPDPARIAAALELLAGPRRRMAMGDRAAATEFNAGLLRLKLRDGFSNAERLAGQTGAEYVVAYRGERRLLDRHLASLSSGFNDPRMVRIYYFWCKQTEKIVIGHLPTHLTNTQS